MAPARSGGCMFDGIRLISSNPRSLLHFGKYTTAQAGSICLAGSPQLDVVSLGVWGRVFSLKAELLDLRLDCFARRQAVATSLMLCLDLRRCCLVLQTEKIGVAEL